MRRLYLILMIIFIVGCKAKPIHGCAESIIEVPPQLFTGNEWLYNIKGLTLAHAACSLSIWTVLTSEGEIIFDLDLNECLPTRAASPLMAKFTFLDSQANKLVEVNQQIEYSAYGDHLIFLEEGNLAPPLTNYLLQQIDLIDVEKSMDPAFSFALNEQADYFKDLLPCLQKKGVTDYLDTGILKGYAP